MPDNTRVLRDKTPPGRSFLKIDIAMALFLIWAVHLVLRADARLTNAALWLLWGGTLLTLTLKRQPDEFWRHCWTRASTATFAALVVIPFAWDFLDFFGGFFHGLTEKHWGTTRSALPTRPTAFDSNTAVMILFTIFFARFQWARFRGGMD